MLPVLRSSALRVAAPLRAVSAGRRFGSTESHDAPVRPAKTIHPEEYIQVAKNWPHEELDPSVFEEAMKTGPDHHVHLGHAKEMPDGTDIHTKEDFSSPLWTKVMASAILLAVVVRANEFYFGDAEVHPFTKFIQQFKEDPLVSEQEDLRWKAVFKKQAEDNLILKEYSFRDKPIHRFVCPDIIERKSDWNVIPGEEPDMSNIKFKHSWQEDDKFFGVPYPQNE